MVLMVVGYGNSPFIRVDAVLRFILLDQLWRGERAMNCVFIHSEAFSKLPFSNLA
jgi:hypothetical protein